MNDLISRKLAIDSIMAAGKIGKLTCCDILKKMPSAQPELLQDGTLVIDTYKYSEVKRVLVQHGTDGTLFYVDEPQWISCKDRLPEEEGYYWTVHSNMSGHIGYYVSRFAKDLYKVDGYDFAELKGVSGFFTIDDEYGYIKMDALAWMPIEPWRGEE